MQKNYSELKFFILLLCIAQCNQIKTVKDETSLIKKPKKYNCVTFDPNILNKHQIKKGVPMLTNEKKSKLFEPEELKKSFYSEIELNQIKQSLKQDQEYLKYYAIRKSKDPEIKEHVKSTIKKHRTLQKKIEIEEYYNNIEKTIYIIAISIMTTTIAYMIHYHAHNSSHKN